MKRIGIEEINFRVIKNKANWRLFSLKEVSFNFLMAGD